MCVISQWCSSQENQCNRENPTVSHCFFAVRVFFRLQNLSRHSSRHGGIVLPDHTYVRQTTRSFPTSDDHDSRYGRSPHIIQTSNGSRLILPVNMEPTPSISTPTSFNSDDESLPSHRDTSFRDPRRKKQPSEHTEQIQTTTFTRY